MRKFVVVGVALVAAVIVGPATAASWTVQAGPTGVVKHLAVPKYADVEQFFPSRLVINAGDSVTFQTKEGHTVTFLGPRKPSDFAFGALDPKNGTYGAVEDAMQQAFWFVGKPRYVYTAGPILAPAGSPTVLPATFHSHAIFGPGPGSPPGSKPSVTHVFTKPGVYKYICLFHYPAMKGSIVVNPARTPGPSIGAAQAAVTSQLAVSVSTAKRLDKAVPPANTIYAGASGKGVDLLAFYPKVLTVKVGATIRLISESRVNGHNIVFTKDRAWAKKYFKTSDQFPFGQVGPEEIYGTDPPGTAYDGSNHGNGFFTTPVVQKGGLPGLKIRSATTLTITTPGTYKYFCEIHGPHMSGTIVVTP